MTVNPVIYQFNGPLEDETQNMSMSVLGNYIVKFIIYMV